MKQQLTDEHIIKKALNGVSIWNITVFCGKGNNSILVKV